MVEQERVLISMSYAALRI